MKKHLLYLAAAGLMALTTACASDDPAPQTAGDECAVTFTVGAPGAINSRAISDGTTVDDLYWVVYTTTDGSIVDTGYKADAFAGDALQTTVTIKFVLGKNYKVAFWAQAKNASCYDCTTTPGTVAVSYTDAVANDEDRDAFYKLTDEFTVTRDYTPDDVVLTRPFAQVNVGATDYQTVVDHGGTVANCGMTFTTYAGTKLNLYTGEISDTQAVTFAKNGLPKNTATDVTPITLTTNLANGTTIDASWLCMNYILVPADRGVVGTVTFVYDGDNGEETRVVNAVPVQRNYRTNIIGDLLTSETDFKIIISPNFNDVDYKVDFE